MENIISTVINLSELSSWPLTKEHLEPHDNMRPTSLFVRIPLLQVMMPSKSVEQAKEIC